MYDRIVNTMIIFTLSLIAFTLVAFGFKWIYDIWLAEELGSWIVTFIGIPVVAVLSASLLYFFLSALETSERDEQRSRQSYWG